MDIIQQYQKWFEYENESHKRVLLSLNTVPNTKRASQDFQKALDLFSHIVAARQFWLKQMGVISDLPDDLFDGGVGIDRLKEHMEIVYHLWENYFDKLIEQELTRIFEYSPTGERIYQNCVEDILAQLFGHSWYHCGQIALIVRTLGGTPAKIDYVFWTRKRLE